MLGARASGGLVCLDGAAGGCRSEEAAAEALLHGDLEGDGAEVVDGPGADQAGVVFEDALGALGELGC